MVCDHSLEAVDLWAPHSTTSYSYRRLTDHTFPSTTWFSSTLEQVELEAQRFTLYGEIIGRRLLFMKSTKPQRDTVQRSEPPRLYQLENTTYRKEMADVNCSHETVVYLPSSLSYTLNYTLMLTESDPALSSTGQRESESGPGGGTPP